MHEESTGKPQFIPRSDRRTKEEQKEKKHDATSMEDDEPTGAVSLAHLQDADEEVERQTRVRSKQEKKGIEEEVEEDDRPVKVVFRKRRTKAL